MEIDKLNLAINIGAMRHQVLLKALCVLVSSLPEAAKQAFAAELRPQIEALMEAATELSHPDMAALVLLDIAKLEAAARQS